MKALICRYVSVFQHGIGASHTLAAHVLLGPAAASRLARAAAAVRTGPTSGAPVNCPNDTGDVATITFSYTARPPIELWWNTTGCQTVDNGTVQAQQLANDSFAAFQATFDTAISA